MPFKFTGTLEKVQIKLGPNELAPQQRGELEQLKRDFALEDVRFWHKTDIPAHSLNVRYRR